MDIIGYLIEHISPLPWIVKGPGFILMALLCLRSFTQIFTLRWIKSATNVVYAFIVALIMARFGLDIVGYIEANKKPPTSQIEQNQQFEQPQQN